MFNATKRTALFLAAALLLCSLTACGKTPIPSSEEGTEDTRSSAAPDSASTDKKLNYTKMETEYELTKLADLRNNREAEIAAVKSENYENLVLSEDFTLNIPDTDTLYQLGLSSKRLSGEECCKRFEELFDSLFGGIYTDEELKELVHFRPDEKHRGLEKENADYPDYMPLYYQYRDEIISGDMGASEILIDTDKCYLELFASGHVHGFSRGLARGKYRPVKEGRPIGFWYPYDYGIPEEENSFTENPCEISDKEVYKLIGGEVSVLEAANTAEKFIEENGFGGSGEFKPKAIRARAVNLGDGYYGYLLTLVRCYKDVNFYDSEETGYYTRHGREYLLWGGGEAFMLEKGEVDVSVGFDGAYDIEEIGEFDSVISFKKAADIFSKSFSAYADINIEKAELVYTDFPLGEYNSGEHEVIPTWHFTVRSLGEDFLYDFWINAVTGEYGYTHLN